MKTFHTFVGIDISKLTLDVSVTQSDKPNKVTHYKVNNNIKGVIGLITQLKNKAVCLEDTLFVCENTGIYPPLYDSYDQPGTSLLGRCCH